MVCIVSTGSSVRIENNQAGAGHDGRTPSYETKFSGAKGDRKIFIFPVQSEHKQSWQPVDPYSAVQSM